MKNKIDIIYGDITKIIVDAIVNPANTSLLGGSGVDGLIHRIGGKKILEECRKIKNKQGGCKTGEAVITSAGNLPAKYVIHTVGPFWNNGNNNEDELLANCYRNCLKIAHDNNILTIAFPNISTGIYKFPKIRAAKIALKTIKDNLTLYSSIKKIEIICYDLENYQIYNSLLKENN